MSGKRGRRRRDGGAGEDAAGGGRYGRLIGKGPFCDHQRVSAGATWSIVGVLMAATLLAFVTRSWVIGRLWGPVFRIAHGTASAALLSVLLYLACMAIHGLVQYAVHAAFGGWLATTLTLVETFAYTPVALMPLPDRDREPFGDLRRELEKAGATFPQARASAWVNGPLSFFGLGAALGPLCIEFAS